MKKLVFVYLLLIAVICPISSQDITSEDAKEKEKPKFYINAGAGIHFYSCLSPSYDFIRSGINYSNYGYYTDSETLKWFYSQVFADLKLEYRTSSQKYWISSGLRYTNLLSSLGRYSSYYSTGSHFYYINMSGESTEITEYYRVKNIDYNAKYIGIPLEVRYTPFDVRFFRLFFKAGADINFLFNEKKNVEFVYSEMDIYEDEILALFNSSPKYYGSAYLGAGIQLGKRGRPAVRVEASFPAFMFSSQSFGLVEPEFGGGVTFSFVVPLK